jgi:hypothetical protein
MTVNGDEPLPSRRGLFCFPEIYQSAEIERAHFAQRIRSEGFERLALFLELEARQSLHSNE